MLKKETIEKIGNAFAEYFNTSFANNYEHAKISGYDYTNIDFNSQGVTIVDCEGKIKSMSFTSKEQIIFHDFLKKFHPFFITHDENSNYDENSGLYYHLDSTFSFYKPYFAYRHKIRNEDHSIESYYFLESKRLLEKDNIKYGTKFRSNKQYITKESPGKFSFTFDETLLSQLLNLTKKLKSDYMFRQWDIEDIIKILNLKKALEIELNENHEKFIELDGTKELLLQHKK